MVAGRLSIKYICLTTFSHVDSGGFEKPPLRKHKRWWQLPLDPLDSDMNKKNINILATIILGLTLLNCVATKSTSVIYSDNYDKQTNTTSVIIFPYGSVKVPGKWVKTRESDVSFQHFFINQDSVTLAIAMNPWNQYEFSSNNPQVSTDNFVKMFYEWDANYLRDKTDGQLEIIKEIKDKDYLVWSLSKRKLPTDYFLFGLKGQVAHSFYITTDKWDEVTIVNFLEKLYTE